MELNYIMNIIELYYVYRTEIMFWITLRYYIS